MLSCGWLGVGRNWKSPCGGGCTIVTDEAIPFILFFVCSITFNILVGSGAWELLTQSPLSRRVWHYTLFYFNDVIKQMKVILQKINICCSINKRTTISLYIRLTHSEFKTWRWQRQWNTTKREITIRRSKLILTKNTWPKTFGLSPKSETTSHRGLRCHCSLQRDLAIYFDFCHYSPELWPIDIFSRAHEPPYVHEYWTFLFWEKKLFLKYVQWKILLNI